MQNYPTDKIEHGLDLLYTAMFAPYRSRPGLTILELGVDKGGFTQWLEDYFDGAARIIAIDQMVHSHFKDHRSKNGGEVLFRKADQIDEAGLCETIRGYEFDIILDDCSHRLDPTRASLRALWPALKSGGLYIIEDWAAGLERGNPFEGLEESVFDVIRQRDFIEARIFDRLGAAKKANTALFIKR